MTFTVLIHDDETGGYWAQVKELPGCISQGETLDELERNIKEAISLMLDGLVDYYVASLDARAGEEEKPPSHVWEIPLSLGKAKTKVRASA